MSTSNPKPSHGSAARGSSAFRSFRAICLVGASLLAALVLGATAAQAQDESSDWPREIVAKDGTTILVYQPHVESFENNKLNSRAAVSVQRKDEDELVFGAIWMVATVEVDREERMVYVQGLKIPRVRFPESTPDQEAALASLVEKSVEDGNLAISLDRLIASLENVERDQSQAEDLRTKSPEILIRTQPSVVILIDGELAPIADDLAAQLLASPREGPPGAPARFAEDAELQESSLVERVAWQPGAQRWRARRRATLGGGPTATASDLVARIRHQARTQQLRALKRVRYGTTQTIEAD